MTALVPHDPARARGGGGAERQRRRGRRHRRGGCGGLGRGEPHLRRTRLGRLPPRDGRRDRRRAIETAGALATRPHAEADA